MNILSILDKFGKIFYNLPIFEDSYTIIEKPTKLQICYEMEIKQKYKNLKYICNNCGAYNHRNQGYCGICMSSHLRKATKTEIKQTLSLLENLFEN